MDGAVKSSRSVCNALLQSSVAARVQSVYCQLGMPRGARMLDSALLCRRGSDAAGATWAVGLLHGVLQASVPAAPPDLWLATVQLAERLGAAPATMLARRACAVHPAAEALAQKLAQLLRAAAGTAGTPDRLLPHMHLRRSSSWLRLP